MINIITEIDKLIVKLKELDFINYVEYYPVFQLGNKSDSILLKIGDSDSIRKNSNGVIIPFTLEVYYISKTKKNHIDTLLERFLTVISTIETNRTSNEFIEFYLDYVDQGNDKQTSFNSQNPSTGNYEGLVVKRLDYLLSYCIKGE
jgi:hypothetical protein